MSYVKLNTTVCKYFFPHLWVKYNVSIYKIITDLDLKN
jgi:hypothetical protein